MFALGSNLASSHRKRALYLSWYSLFSYIFIFQDLEAEGPLLRANDPHHGNPDGRSGQPFTTLTLATLTRSLNNLAPS